MKRLNFTLDEEAVQLLDQLAATYYHGNKSQTVRAALESLATHIGHDGWVITGYTPMKLATEAACHTCGVSHHEGEVLFRDSTSPPRTCGMSSWNWIETLSFRSRPTARWP